MLPLNHGIMETESVGSQGQCAPISFDHRASLHIHDDVCQQHLLPCCIMGHWCSQESFVSVISFDIAVNGLPTVH